MNKHEFLKFIEEFNKPIQEIIDKKENLRLEKIEKVKRILNIDSKSTELMFVCGKNIYPTLLQISDVCEVVEDKLNLVAENGFIMIEDYKLNLQKEPFEFKESKFLMSPFNFA